MSNPTPISNNFDVMIDIETLSLHYQCSWILSIAVVPFINDWERAMHSESWPPLAIKLRDPETVEQKLIPRVVDSTTIDWWMADEREAARRELAKLPEMDYDQGLQRVVNYINAADHVWARGPQFDLSNIWAQAALRNIEITKLPYAWRDSRTLSDMYGHADYIEFIKRVNECPHSALHDARAEVEFVQFMRMFMKQNKADFNAPLGRH